MKQSVKLILLSVLFCAYCTTAQDEGATDPGSDDESITLPDEIFGNGTNRADSHRAGRIVKGTVVSIAAFPYLVTVIVSDNSGLTTTFHGGAVISSTQVLTAATSLFSSSGSATVTVRAGSNFQTKEGTLFQTTGYVKHPAYVPSSSINNVAVITIQGTFVGVPNVQPIAVATIPLDPSAPNLANCFLVGWGTDENGVRSINPKQAEYKLLTDATCKSTFPSLLSTQHCAQSVTGFGCFEDDGGPLVCNNLLYSLFGGGGCNFKLAQTTNLFVKLPVDSIQSFLSPYLPVTLPAKPTRKNYVSCP